MELEYLKVGRMYRVKQGRKLLNLRLKEIQPLKGKGTPLYELKITTLGYQLWMLDEHIGKGYVIKSFAVIEDEVKEKPKANSLVQIVRGPLLKTLGSVTVYRVKEVKLNETTHEPTVVIFGDFKNYELPMDDVRVYEASGVDPETLLSKQSKAIGQMPRVMLPGPAPVKSRLLAALGKPQKYGSMSNERETPEETRVREAKEAEKEKKKQEYFASLKAKKEAQEKVDKGEVKGGKQSEGIVEEPKKSKKKGDDPLKGKKPKGKKQKVTELVKSEGEEGPDPMNEHGTVITSPTHQTGPTTEQLTDRDSSDEIPVDEDTTLAEADTPDHLKDLSVPMHGAEIHPGYWDSLADRRKKSKQRKV